MFRSTRLGGVIAMAAAVLPLGLAAEQTANGGAPGARQAEFLDRGVLAVKTADAVFVSWRSLGNESYGTANAS